MVDSGTKETGIATSSQVEFRIDNIQAGHISFLFYFYLFLFFIRYFLHLHFKCYPKSPLYPTPVLLPYPYTPTSWPWHSPVLGHIIFARPWVSPPIDGHPLGHPLLHMQLETRALGVLVSSCCCSTYRVADPFSYLGTFSSSSIGGPLFHPIDLVRRC